MDATFGVSEQSTQTFENSYRTSSNAVVADIKEVFVLKQKGNRNRIWPCLPCVGTAGFTLIPQDVRTTISTWGPARAEAEDKRACQMRVRN